MDLRTPLLAAALVAFLAAPALASQCPSIMAEIDAALETAELTDEERARVEELRAEGERLHEAGDHDASVETLSEAQAMLE